MWVAVFVPAEGGLPVKRAKKSTDVNSPETHFILRKGKYPEWLRQNTGYAMSPSASIMSDRWSRQVCG